MKTPVLVLFVTALLAACQQQPTNRTPPPASVGFVTLHPQSVALQNELSGRVTASLKADVRPQVTGIVKARRFVEGSLVKAGQVLYVIDPATYQAADDQARATLLSSQSAVPAAKMKSERYAALSKIQSVSKQDADDAFTAYQQALALVAQNRASAESARINLDYTQVRAPISGRIGTSSVTPGALVTTSQTDAMATIRALDPIYVDLTQSSVALLRLRTALSAGGMTAGSAAVRLKLEDGSDYARAGRLQFAEVAVDEATGSVTLRASFPNPDGTLLPGMYVRAVLDEAIDPKAILAPQRGITRDAKGNATALVVSAADKLEQRVVTTQRVIGDRWLVSSGLVDGDRLVVDGLGKVKVGDVVNAVDATAKPDTTAGQPANPVPVGTS